MTDESGYVLDEFGDRIIVAQYSISVDPAYRAIGGQLRKKAGNVFSFRVKKEDTDKWYLITNRNTFIGRYPSQDACISVLYGIMTFNDGQDDAFAVWLEDGLSRNISEIDPDVNIVTTAEADPEITGTIQNFNYATAVGSADVTGGVYMAYETSTDGQTWTGLGVSTVIGTALTAGDDGSTIIRTTTDSAWSLLPENGYIRVCIAGVDAGLNFTCLVAGNSIFKDDVDDTDLSGLTMVISGDSTAGEPVVRGGYAYSVVDESGAVLDHGESISYTYAWYREIPTLTSLDSTQI